MNKGGRPRRNPEGSILPPSAEIGDVHDKETKLLSIASHDKPNIHPDQASVTFQEMARAANLPELEADEHYIDATDLIEANDLDKVGVEKLKTDILETITALKNSPKSAAEASPEKPHLTPKGKRIIEQYLPHLFDKKPPQLFDGKTGEKSPKEKTKRKSDEKYQIKKELLNPADLHGIAKLLEKAGFDPETTTLGVVRADLLSKKHAVEKELKRRGENKKIQMEVGIDAPLRQLEALEVLQDLIGITEEIPKNKPLTREKILQLAKEGTPEQRAKKEVAESAANKKLKELVVHRIKKEIETFAQQFNDRYESEEVRKTVEEQRRSPTEISIPIIKPPTRLERFLDRFSPKKRRLAKELKRRELTEKKEQQQFKQFLRKDPTFAKEGFLLSSGLQDALSGDFSSFDELRQKVVTRLLKNEQRLEESYSVDLGKRPVETLTQLADVENYDLKRLLANNEMLERILEIIDQREVFARGQDIVFQEEELSNPTTQLYERFSTAVPALQEKKTARRSSAGRSA